MQMEGKGEGEGEEEEEEMGYCRWCCMCGDVGFSEDLLPCPVCRYRVQHTYCSRLYPEIDMGRWQCEWCLRQEEEEEVNEHRSKKKKTQQQQQNNQHNRDERGKRASATKASFHHSVEINSSSMPHEDNVNNNNNNTTTTTTNNNIRYGENHNYIPPPPSPREKRSCRQRGGDGIQDGNEEDDQTDTRPLKYRGIAMVGNSLTTGKRHQHKRGASSLPSSSIQTESCNIQDGWRKPNCNPSSPRVVGARRYKLLADVLC